MTALRIVSLVPSLTELVFAFGRGDWLAGRTRFCSEPADAVSGVPIVGGTKNPVIARIVNAAPDLVIANREENRKEDIDALEAAGLRVLVTDPNSVAEAIAMITELGALLDAADAASALAAEIERSLASVVRQSKPPGVFVAVWSDPLMGLGGNAYGHDLIERCGARNVLREQSRYPQLTMDELRALEPDLILLPDEPFPFAQKHVPAFSGIALAVVVDGKLTWWYGPRMPEAIRTLSQLFATTAGRG